MPTHDETWACRIAIIQMSKAGKTAKYILKELRKEGYSNVVIRKALDNI